MREASGQDGDGEVDMELSEKEAAYISRREKVQGLLVHRLSSGGRGRTCWEVRLARVGLFMQCPTGEPFRSGRW